MRRIRTVMAVFRKELTQVTRYKDWIVGLFVWPLIFPLMYILSGVGMAGPDGGGFKTFSKVTGTDNFMGFVVIGTMAWSWVNRTMWSFGTFLRDEQNRGTLESNWLCPISRFDLLIGGGFMNLVISILVILISVLEYRLVFGIHFSGSVINWIVAFLVMIPGVYGFGAIFASLVLWVKETNSAVHLARGMMMLLCGITYPITLMPSWMQGAAKCLPFTFGISAARKLMIQGLNLGAAGKDLLLCLLVGVIYLLMGRMSFMAVERQVRNSGSLERF